MNKYKMLKFGDRVKEGDQIYTHLYSGGYWLRVKKNADGIINSVHNPDYHNPVRRVKVSKETVPAMSDHIKEIEAAFIDSFSDELKTIIVKLDENPNAVLGSLTMSYKYALETHSETSKINASYLRDNSKVLIVFVGKSWMSVFDWLELSDVSQQLDLYRLSNLAVSLRPGTPNRSSSGDVDRSLWLGEGVPLLRRLRNEILEVIDPVLR